MPAPLIGQARAGAYLQSLYMQYGGLPNPIGNNVSAGNMTYIDLNDGVNWFAQGLELPDAHILETAQYLYRGRAGWTAEDYLPILIKVPFRFEEGGGFTLASQAALLMTSGQQYLTFDAATGILCKLRGLGTPKLAANGIVPLRWDGILEFLAAEPFFKDLVASSVLGTAIVAGANNLTTTYPGSFQCEPAYQINVPAGNTAVLSTLVVSNTDSGEALSLSGLTVGAGAHTIIIDSQAMKATIDGTETDIGGSFPDLYPIVGGGVNHFTVTVTLGSGSIAGWTFDTRWTNRWIVP